MEIMFGSKGSIKKQRMSMKQALDGKNDKGQLARNAWRSRSGEEASRAQSTGVQQVLSTSALAA